ncbi:MAG: hypothetical protein HONBIEJF_01045 [Fimbriimonadaceae bacterium]|nr:hypothetical protein [Fimbriimonadaceae bacterium]
MGIDAASARYLMVCRAAEVPFGRVITLGRQSMHVDALQLGRCSRELGLGWTSAQIRQALSDPQQACEPFFQLLGAERVDSIDASDYEGASFVHDLNKPVEATLHEAYDLVFDGGTIEHVFNFPTAIESAMKMVRPGGHFLSVTVANNFVGHGFYQFSPELFFRIFSPDYGFEPMGVYLYEQGRTPDFTWMRVADPATTGSRVLLRNTMQTHIAVHARRIGPWNGFQSAPQQSDYSALWSDPDGGATGRTLCPSGVKARRRALRSRWQAMVDPLTKPLEAVGLGLGKRAYDGRHYEPCSLDLALANALRRRLGG